MRVNDILSTYVNSAYLVFSYVTCVQGSTNGIPISFKVLHCTNGTISNTTGTNDNANGTNGSPNVANGTIGSTPNGAVVICPFEILIISHCVPRTKFCFLIVPVLRHCLFSTLYRHLYYMYDANLG